MRKSTQHFECRDDLWQRVQMLATARGLSTDDVVQASLLRLFLDGQAEGSIAGAVVTAVEPAQLTATSVATQVTPASAVSGAAASSASSSSLSLPSPGVASSSQSSGSLFPAAKNTRGALANSLAARLAARGPTPRPGTLPKEAADAIGAAVNAASQTRPLYVEFEGAWYIIDKDEYVIGRGRKYSELTIKDANISRRHCSIVRKGPDYYVKDLGSTNGVEFHGVRVDNHKITEGSVYHLCSHELRFSYVLPNAPVLTSQQDDDLD